MDNWTRALGLAAVAALTTGCSINKTVEPLPAAPVSKICILENPKVLMDGFQPEVVSQLQAMNHQTHIYTGVRPTECSHHLEYTANWAWDFAMYLTYAEFRVYDARGIASPPNKKVMDKQIMAVTLLKGKSVDRWTKTDLKENKKNGAAPIV